MKQMTKYMLASAVAMMSLSAAASVAVPRVTEVEQPDGTLLAVRLVGDEHHHFTQTAEGEPIVKGADGFYYFMTVDKEGKTCASAFKAGSKEGVEYAKRADFTPVFEALTEERYVQEEKRMVKRNDRYNITTFPSTGEVRTIVILVEYKDVKFSIENPKEAFEEMLNGENYTLNGSVGSAAEWFRAGSMGNFKPVFDVYGPVELDHDMKYYGGNNDANARQMIVEGCRKLDDQIDFSQYDYNNDEIVDNVFVFYAGYGEMYGAQYEDTVWPHSWELMRGEILELDGVRLNHYACTCELDMFGKMTGIGPFCHEFCHVLGLADHYSTEYNGAFTPGPWDAMDTGEHNDNGHKPPILNAFERYSLLWLEPREIGLEPEDVTLQPIFENDACIIKTSKESEFFLLENRRQESWDSEIPYSGMLVWHIDFDAATWVRNTVNNDRNHQRVDIIEADGTESEASRAADCFPGKRNVKKLTDESYPRISTWTGEKVNKPITDIMETEEGLITFKICGGSPTEGNEAGIMNIEDCNQNATFFNLQGIPVDTPAKGQILIRKSGNKTEKSIIR